MTTVSTGVTVNDRTTRYSVEGQEDGSYTIEAWDFCNRHGRRKCKCPLEYKTLASGLTQDNVATLIQSAGMALAGQSYLY
jgi:hypothetical protein